MGHQLQITASSATPATTTPPAPARSPTRRRRRSRRSSRTTPRSASYRFESKAVAFEKVKQLLGPEKFQGPNPAAHRRGHARSRCWITLKDPDQYQGIEQRGRRASTASPTSATSARPSGRSSSGSRSCSWRLGRHRAVPGPRGAAAGRQHDPAGGLRAPPRDRHHAAGRRLDALHRAALPARGAGDRRDRRRARRRGARRRSCTSASRAAERPGRVHPVDRPAASSCRPRSPSRSSVRCSRCSRHSC